MAATKAEITAYIRRAARARGIDPNTAVKVARSEGLNGNPADGWQSNYRKNGVREPSYGPYQLYMGGGLGNRFQAVTGRHPKDPETVYQQIDFALDNAAQDGWGAWYGAAKVGVSNWQGLKGAEAIGIQSSYGASGGPVPPASVSSLGSRTLRYKPGRLMKGDDVKALQAMLKQAGYDPGEADGIFGMQTKRAVEAYQQAYSAARQRAGGEAITVDGIVGPDTREPMVRAMEAQRANLPGVARYNALTRPKPEAVAGADLAPGQAVEPAGAPRGDLAGQRRMEDQGVLNAKLAGPMAALSGVSTRPARPDPTALSKEDFLRAIMPNVQPGMVRPNAPSVAGNQISTRAQFPQASAIETAKQSIRDQFGRPQIDPRQVGVDPRNLPVEAGTGGGVFNRPAYSEAEARQNAIQNLRGNLLAGSGAQRSPQVAFNSATGRGPSTVRPTAPPSPRANPELATVEQMRESFRRVPMPRGGSVPLGIGSSARGIAQTPRSVPTAPVRARQVTGSPMAPSGHSRATISAYSRGAPAQSVSSAPSAVATRSISDMVRAAPKAATASAAPGTPPAPGVARYNALAATAPKVPYRGPPPAMPSAQPQAPLNVTVPVQAPAVAPAAPFGIAPPAMAQMISTRSAIPSARAPARAGLSPGLSRVTSGLSNVSVHRASDPSGTSKSGGSRFTSVTGTNKRGQTVRSYTDSKGRTHKTTTIGRKDFYSRG